MGLSDEQSDALARFLTGVSAKGVVRRVRTPAGIARYKQPINSVIVPDVLPNSVERASDVLDGANAGDVDPNVLHPNVIDYQSGGIGHLDNETRSIVGFVKTSALSDMKGNETDDDQIDVITEDIRKNGIREPLVIEFNPKSGLMYVGDGNHRLTVAEKLGYEWVPARVLVSRYEWSEDGIEAIKKNGGSPRDSGKTEEDSPWKGNLGEAYWPREMHPTFLLGDAVYVGSMRTRDNTQGKKSVAEYLVDLQNILSELEAKGVQRHVRDVEFWGAPYGTPLPLPPGFKKPKELVKKRPKISPEKAKKAKFARLDVKDADPEVIAAARDITEMKWKGFSTTVNLRKSSLEKGVFWISGDVYKDGKKVGFYQRVLDYEDREMENAGLVLSPSVQGQGFAERFYKHVEEKAYEQGIRRVRIFANIDVGGYAWARRGFNFRDQAQRELFKDVVQMFADSEPGEVITLYGINYTVTPSVIAQAQRLLRRWRSVTPLELSQLGERARSMRTTKTTRGGRKVPMWPGKSLMLGSGWRGIKPLTKPKGKKDAIEDYMDQIEKLIPYAETMFIPDDVFEPHKGNESDYNILGADLFYDPPLNFVADLETKSEYGTYEEKGVRRVRDPEYWGVPYGTIIVPGMKPNGPNSTARRTQQTTHDTVARKPDINDAITIWKGDTGCRAIRQSAYDLLGYDLDERTRFDPPLNEEYISKFRERHDTDSLANIMLDRIRKAEPSEKYAYRTVWVDSLDSSLPRDVLADLKSTDTIDVPLASFSLSREIAEGFNGAGILFVLEPGAKGFRARWEEEFISGGRFKVVSVRDSGRGRFIKVVIRQIGVFDSKGKIVESKAVNRKPIWKHDYLFDTPTYFIEIKNFLFGTYEEKGVRRVRDVEYWGMPYGTIITPGMKPRSITDADIPRMGETHYSESNPPPYLYRAVSEDDWRGIQDRGYMQSDERMNVAQYEGTVAADRDPSFYLPWGIGAQGRILRIKYDPADMWWRDSDGYWKTNSKIPLSRIDATTDLYVDQEKPEDYTPARLLRNFRSKITRAIHDVPGFEGYGIPAALREYEWQEGNALDRWDREVTKESLTKYLDDLDKYLTELSANVEENAFNADQQTYDDLVAGVRPLIRQAREGLERPGLFGNPEPEYSSAIQMRLPGMPKKPEVSETDRERLDRIRENDDRDDARRSARYMQGLIDKYNRWFLFDEDNPDVTRSESILYGEFGVEVADLEYGDASRDQVISSGDWIRFGGCRQIREAAYDILGFDRHEIFADPHLHGGDPGWGGADWEASRPEASAYHILEKLRDSERSDMPLYRGIGILGFDQEAFIEDLRVGGTFDLPVASFTGDETTARAFGEDILFKIERGARYVQGAFMGIPDSVVEQMEEQSGTRIYEEDFYEDPKYSELVSGGRFKVTHVKQDGATFIVTIRQVGVFDPDTGLAKKAINRRWKYAYLFDSSLPALIADTVVPRVENRDTRSNKPSNAKRGNDAR